LLLETPAVPERPLRACAVPRDTSDATEATRGRCEWLWRSLVETTPGAAMKRRPSWAWSSVWVSDRCGDTARVAEKRADDTKRVVMFLNAEYRRIGAALIVSAPIAVQSVTVTTVRRFAENAAIVLGVSQNAVEEWLWTGSAPV
jgi:hypothetical protein